MSAVILNNGAQSSVGFKKLLNECDNVNLLGTTQRLNSGLEMIQKYKPDIFFVDGESLHHDDGLFLAGLSKQYPFTHIVLICSSCVKAKVEAAYFAADFLINPVDRNKLHLTVERIKDDIRINMLENQLDQLLRVTKNKKVVLVTNTGYQFINPRKIVFSQADSNYTEVTLSTKEHILVTKSLCHFYEESLPFPEFIRISRSVVINKQYLAEVVKSERKCILKVGDDSYSFIASPEYFKMLKKNNFSRWSSPKTKNHLQKSIFSLLNKDN